MTIPEPLKRALKGAFEVSASLTGTTLRVATREPFAALTFDDGPDPTWTPKLLSILEGAGARGTFFVVGKQAAQHPELVARLTAGGHAVGNHTWDHPSLPTLRSRYRRLQLRWCQEALGEHASGLFRPPYGHQTLASQLDGALLGLRGIGWSAIAEDWLDDPAETLVARVERRLAPGAIVLFHDRLATTVDPRYCDRAPTLRAVELLLARWRGRLQFVTVPELLRRGAARRWHWYQRPNVDWLRRLV